MTTDLQELLREARDELDATLNVQASPDLRQLINRIDAALAEPAPEPPILTQEQERIKRWKETLREREPLRLPDVPPPASQLDARDHVIAQHILALRQLLDIWDAGMPDE